jgi:hypothetical protein
MHPNNQQQSMAMTIDILNQRIEALEKQLALILENKTSELEKPQKSKKTKKSKDESSDSEDKPKTKRVSGYILFSNATRDEVRDSLTKDEEKPKNTDIMKELARLWKELSDEDKEPWNAKAKELKDNA